MSLLRLLTTGKSLVGLNDTEPRYRVTRQRFLPEFGPVKNPFGTRDKSDSPEPEGRKRIADASASKRQIEKRVRPLPASDSSGAPNVTASKVAAMLVSGGGRGRASSLRLRASALGAKWTGKLRTLFSRPGGKPARVSLLRASKVPVQGELSLDKIKVVRNDLSDADLEVVPSKLAMGRAGATPPLPALDRNGSGGVSWSRFSGLFRGSRM